MNLRKILPVLFFISISFASCTVEDVVGWINKGVDIYNKVANSRGVKPEIVEIKNFKIQASRSASGAVLSVLLKTTEVTYSVLPYITAETKQTFMAELKKGLAESKQFEEIVCDETKACIIGKNTGSKISEVVVFTEKEGNLCMVGLKGEFTKEELISLANSAQVADLVDYLKP